MHTVLILKATTSSFGKRINPPSNSSFVLQLNAYFRSYTLCSTKILKFQDLTLVCSISARFFMEWREKLAALAESSYLFATAVYAKSTHPTYLGGLLLLSQYFISFRLLRFLRLLRLCLMSCLTLSFVLLLTAYSLLPTVFLVLCHLFSLFRLPFSVYYLLPTAYSLLPTPYSLRSTPNAILPTVLIITPGFPLTF